MATILGTAFPAYAGGSVAVLLNGNSTKFPVVEAHFGEWLRAHGEVLMAPSIEISSSIVRLADCFVRENLDCARAIVDSTASANTLLYVDVSETAGTPPDLAFTAYWFEKGRDVFVARGSCQGCTTASLRSTTDGIMTRLTRIAAERRTATKPPESVSAPQAPPAKRPISAPPQLSTITPTGDRGASKRVNTPPSLPPRAGSASIVLEVHDGQRSKDAARLGPFLDEMERLGADARPESIRARFRGRLPRLGSDPSKKPADAERLQDYALSVWKRQPPPKDLLPPLRQAVTETFDNAAYLIADPNRREPLRRLLIALALTYRRIGDVDNAEAIEMELIRSYPNQAVTESQDGPDATELYEEVRTHSLPLGRGTLTVTVNDPSLQVYVDETARRPNLPNADLVPGPYRVVVIDVNKHARRYDVEVLHNQDSVLDVDWDADSAFVYTPDSAALIFQTRSARIRDAELARRLLRSFDNSTVTLISISRSAGAMADAAYYSTQTGRLLRHAQTKLGTKDEQARLFALARFVAKGLESPDVTVLEKWAGETPLASSGPVTAAPADDSVDGAGSETTAARPQSAEPGGTSDGHPHVVPGVVTSVGAVALGVGIYLSATATVDPAGPRSQYVYSGPGIGLAVGGALAVGVGVYLWHRASPSQHPRSAPTLSVSPTGTAIGWASEF